METKGASASGIVAILFVTGLVAQAKPDFSGTWTLIAATDKSGDLMKTREVRLIALLQWDPETITIEGQKMTVSKPFETLVYMLDGTPSKDEEAGYVLTSKWEGKTLVTTMVFDDSITMSGKQIEKRRIGADGTMVVEMSGSRDQTLVYKKK